MADECRLKGHVEKYTFWLEKQVLTTKNLFELFYEKKKSVTSTTTRRRF
jgi:hypothetical protein